jgi:hypothetical protein
MIRSNSNEFKSFPTAQSWRHAYKLLQKILKSIKHLGIYLGKMLSSFFIRTKAQETMFKKFKRDMMRRKAKQKNPKAKRKKSRKKAKYGKNVPKMDGKQAE